MSRKMKDRFFVHENFDFISQFEERDSFPIEYGGKLELQELIDSLFEKLEEKHEILLLNDDIKLNLELYPPFVRELSPSALNLTIEEMIKSKNVEKHTNFENVQGSFRKLEID